MAERKNRGHVAIAFTDLKDSTRLGREYGETRWAPIREEHFRIADQCIATNGGRLVKRKTEGDAVIARFDVDDQAAKFALDLQRAWAQWNQGRPGEPAILVRIGVHSGIVESKGQDIFGNEVNRAARIAAEAEGGQILVSHAIQRAVENLGPAWAADVEFLDHGEKVLKGFKEPDRIFELLDKQRLPAAAAPERPAVEQAAKKYTAQLAQVVFRFLKLRGFPDLRDKAPVALPKVFEWPRVARPLRSAAQEHVEMRRPEEKKSELARTGLEKGGPRVVFLGQPGSGKTTLLRYVGLSEIEKLPGEKKGGGKVPVYIEIRHLDKSLREPRPPDLWPYVHAWCANTLELKLPAGFFETLWEQGRLLLLFDGLDEVAADARRATIVDFIETIAGELPKGNRVVVSSRVAGYWRTPLAPQQFRHLEILDFGDREIQAFLGKWYVVRETSRRAAREAASKLWQALQHAHIREIAGNPLLLTMIALIHRAETKLPEGRAVLYDKCTECLLDLWTASKELEAEIPELKSVGLRNKRKILGQIAYQAQLQATAKQRETGVTIEQPWLLRQLEVFAADLAGQSRAAALAEALLHGLRVRDGVLAEQRLGHYAFLHKTFQEYFAALHLAETIKTPEQARERIQQHLDDPWWRETLCLAVAQMSPAVRSEVLLQFLSRGQAFFAWECLQSGVEEDRWLDLLIRYLAQCFQGYRGEPPSLLTSLEWWKPERVMPVLSGVFQKDHRDGRVLYPALQMLEALAKQGVPAAADLREAFFHEYPKRRPEDDGMVCVQAGTFQMGDTFGDGYADELPVRGVQLDTFWMGRFPVTNAEYKQMIPGHARTDNHPVVNVSWYEADLYCRWSGGHLPSEAEWEKAAGWDPEKRQKRKYPWGDEWDPQRCNWWENGPRTTTPPGTYLDGRSAYGCEDMAGNVWEWTNSAYSADELGPRVLRGGSFLHVNPRLLRCSCRLGPAPVSRSVDVGFRRARTG
jgi:formylglycine-generating enzyme required for sulfatase activity/class 3 adenylate cyclase